MILEGTLIWKISDFSKIRDKIHYSDNFTVGGHKWRIMMFPKGNKAKFLSLYLDVANSADLPADWSHSASFKLVIRSHFKEIPHITKDASHQFTAEEEDWGFTQFMPLSDLHDPNKGYLHNDRVEVEAHVTISGEISKPPLVNIPVVLSKHISASKFSDVEILVGERVFPAHRLILSRCAFFEAAFENDCVENSDGKIVMHDMNADAFQLVLEYLYTDKVNIPVECDALALRSAAAFLGLPHLQQRCEKAIQKRLCVDNLAKCYRYAKVNSMNHLKRRCVAVATESISTLASVQLTKDYIELVESDEELKQDFLEDIRSSGK